MRAVTLCLFVALTPLAGCKEETPAPPAGDAKPEAAASEEAPPATDAARKEAYVQAAIQIACAGRTIADNAKLAAAVARIQKESGFDTKSWTDMALVTARDPAATRRISEGAASCD